VQRSEGRIDRSIKVLKENRFPVQSVYRYVFSAFDMHDGFLLGPQSLQCFAVDFPLVENVGANGALNRGLDGRLARNIRRGLEPEIPGEIT